MIYPQSAGALYIRARRTLVVQLSPLHQTTRSHFTTIPNFCHNPFEGERQTLLIDFYHGWNYNDEPSEQQTNDFNDETWSVHGTCADGVVHTIRVFGPSSSRKTEE